VKLVIFLGRSNKKIDFLLNLNEIGYIGTKYLGFGLSRLIKLSNLRL